MTKEPFCALESSRLGRLRSRTPATTQEANMLKVMDYASDV